MGEVRLSRPYGLISDLIKKQKQKNLPRKQYSQIPGQKVHPATRGLAWAPALTPTPPMHWMFLIQRIWAEARELTALTGLRAMLMVAML